MAITLGSTPVFKPLRLVWTAYSGDKANQVKELDPETVDQDIIELLTNLDAMSNAKYTGKFDGRLISGQKGTAVNALQSLISVFMILNFTGTDSVSGKTVHRSWVVPAPADALVGSGGAPNPATQNPITTVNGNLASFILQLEGFWGFQQVDGTWNWGGLTYEGGAFATGNDVVDGI